MERESFEDEEVAKLLNDNFVSIKVDREERPDIDHIYMTYCQAMTGSGGWPLTIIMTPDKKPFYAGTYFPKTGKMGMYGLIDILSHLLQVWKEDKEKLLESVEEIKAQMKPHFEHDESESLNLDVVHRAYREFEQSFRKDYGGFNSAPKFPTPHSLMFLLRYWKITGNGKALEMVEKTLESMYRGGIFDHIGYGFSRYSVDNKWLVPHFEKMLYDNALLAISYLECYQATGRKFYADIAKNIFDYILRDMTDEEGGFYSAEDADSEGEEGKFYVWTLEEVNAVLGGISGERFSRLYDITERGNFEGRNIPNLISLIALGTKGNTNLIGIQSAVSEVSALRERLFEHREKRVHPYKDDKILTSWNGLMIAALAIGARILRDKRYEQAALRASGFILSRLRDDKGRLLARYRKGEAAINAYVDDYAFMIWALIELYETTFNAEYLKDAMKLNEQLIKYFWDDENGGLFIYGSDSEELLFRPKEIYDGAIPSGNSVATLNWLRLSRLTGKNELEDMAFRQFKAFGESVNNHLMGYSYFLMAILFGYSRTNEIVVVGNMDDPMIKSAAKSLHERFMPHSVYLNKKQKEDEINDIVPYIKEYTLKDDKFTAYICENHACMEPITDLSVFKSEIERLYGMEYNNET